MSETQIEQHPATGFDVEAWLQDAHLPEESADVFKRADVIGKLSALQRRIELLREAAAGAERSAGDTDELAPLEAQYKELVDTFCGSQLTVYVRALGPDERTTLRQEHDKATEGLDPAKANGRFGYEVLAKAIVAVEPFGGTRTPVSWTAEQVRKMENTIGGTQMSLVMDAHRVAQNKVPEVDADFLHRPSGAEAGQG